MTIPRCIVILQAKEHYSTKKASLHSFVFICRVICSLEMFSRRVSIFWNDVPSFILVLISQEELIWWDYVKLSTLVWLEMMRSSVLRSPGFPPWAGRCFHFVGMLKSTVQESHPGTDPRPHGYIMSPIVKCHIVTENGTRLLHQCLSHPARTHRRAGHCSFVSVWSREASYYSGKGYDLCPSPWGSTTLLM